MKLLLLLCAFIIFSLGAYTRSISMNGIVLGKKEVKKAFNVAWYRFYNNKEHLLGDIFIHTNTYGNQNFSIHFLSEGIIQRNLFIDFTTHRLPFLNKKVLRKYLSKPASRYHGTIPH